MNDKLVPLAGEEIAQLIARSARGLSLGDYAPEQVEAALQGAFGVDTGLIADGTYYVAEAHPLGETVIEVVPVAMG